MDVESKALDVPELPSADLMGRVAGTEDPDWFVKSGRWSVRNIESALRLIDTELSDYGRVLEWGCGCGRILLHLKDLSQEVELHGVDIDHGAVAWARQHVPWVNFGVCDGLPPLEFPDDSFDLIFNHSVLTHLDQEYETVWLAELRRVVKSGGPVLLSVNGMRPFAEHEEAVKKAGADSTPRREAFDTKGFIHIREDGWKGGPFPDFYHSTFHAPWYVFRRWSQVFDIKAYIVGGALGSQDLILLQKRVPDTPAQVQGKVGTLVKELAMSAADDEPGIQFSAAVPTAGPGNEVQKEPVGRTVLLPPYELRRLVGPVEEELFDNPNGDLVFPEIPAKLYESVFDFGCGCGRIARQLIQQRTPPRRYVGVDLHREMVNWCQQNLAPHADGFEFHHHNTYNAGFNPLGRKKPLPFPVADASSTLLLAWSVFTHLTEEDVAFYLSEVSRVLDADGQALTTWFLFDKGGFPMLQEFQNALYINHTDPTNAVIFDKTWLRGTVEDVGLNLLRVEPPSTRGHQWRIDLEKRRRGSVHAEFPEDSAPFGPPWRVGQPTSQSTIDEPPSD